ncbi:hypothetical protein ACV1DK_12380, partial [Aeromonas taiwanensis]
MRTQIIDKTVVVSSVEGNVQILLADGSSRPLQPGEILQPGARLNIADDAKLMLAPYDDSQAPAAYSHAWRSLNNIHADHVITSMPITQ